MTITDHECKTKHGLPIVYKPDVVLKLVEIAEKTCEFLLPQ